MSKNVNIKIEQVETENEFILKIDDVVYKKQRPNALSSFKLYSKLFSKIEDTDAITNIMSQELLKVEIQGFGVIENEQRAGLFFKGDKIKHLPVVLEWSAYRGLEDFLGENQYLSHWSKVFASSINKQSSAT